VRRRRELLRDGADPGVGRRFPGRRAASAGGGVPAIPLATLGALLAPFLLLLLVTEVDRSRISLPASRVRVDAGRDAACVVIARESGEETWGALVYRFSDGKEASGRLGGPTDVFLAALRVVTEDPGRPFAIKADAGVRYDLVDDVLEQLRKAGVREVTLLTQASEAGSTP
jgi:biopolymer transport protein ExbD